MEREGEFGSFTGGKPRFQAAVSPPEAYECPILMMPIQPEQTVVMPCCCHVVSKDALDMVRNGACPFCRAPLSANLLGHGRVQELLGPLLGQHNEREEEPDPPYLDDGSGWDKDF